MSQIRDITQCMGLVLNRLRIKNVGMWRSLVAHYAGGVGVVGSNLAIPTIFFNIKLPLPPKITLFPHYAAKLCRKNSKHIIITRPNNSS